MTDELETGTGSFLNRFGLTRRLEENLEAFLSDHGVDLSPYGNPVVLRDSPRLQTRLKKPQAKAGLPATMVKFTPDYIAIPQGDPSRLFLLDAKVSITPVFFGTQVDRVSANRPKAVASRTHEKRPPILELTASDIGEIEREAWFSYNRFYPSRAVAIVMAVPYSPRVLLADWVSNIQCMWCKRDDRADVPWDCEACPVFGSAGGAFGVMVNKNAAGSGTPHTNLFLSQMRTLDQFLLEEFAIPVDKDNYDLMLNIVKSWPLSKPYAVNWTQYNRFIARMKPTCPWLQYRIKDEFFDEDPTRF